jgi:hypothetical protein
MISSIRSSGLPSASGVPMSTLRDTLPSGFGVIIIHASIIPGTSENIVYPFQCPSPRFLQAA